MLPAPLHPLSLPPGVTLPDPSTVRRPTLAGPLPKLTVVTPSFNQAGFLETTIRSVLGEQYPALEYFVIDGGSRDHSRTIIEHYAPQLAGWVSEPDRGQVDAILKGLARATGEWFIWINSDDVLAPGTLWKVAEAAMAGPADLICGAIQEFDAAKFRRRYQCRDLTVRGLILEQLPNTTRWHQPGIWMRREALNAVDLDLESHYRFDYELLIRFLRRFPDVRYLHDTLAYFRLHSTSKTVSLGPRFRVEHLQILERLAAEPEFADYRDDLAFGHRIVSWLQRIDALLTDFDRPRLERLGEIVRAIREDPAARNTRNTRRAMRRILLKGGKRPRG